MLVDQEDDAEELSEDAKALLESFVDGYFSGYKAGIKAAASIMRQAAKEKKRPPLPPMACKWVALFGRVLDKQAAALTRKAIDAEISRSFDRVAVDDDQD